MPTQNPKTTAHSNMASIDVMNGNQKMASAMMSMHALNGRYRFRPTAGRSNSKAERTWPARSAAAIVDRTTAACSSVMPPSSTRAGVNKNTFEKDMTARVCEAANIENRQSVQMATSTTRSMTDAASHSRDDFILVATSVGVDAPKCEPCLLISIDKWALADESSNGAGLAHTRGSDMFVQLDGVG